MKFCAPFVSQIRPKLQKTKLIQFYPCNLLTVFSFTTNKTYQFTILLPLMLTKRKIMSNAIFFQQNFSFFIYFHIFFIDLNLHVLF
ncbi:unnamed protein product [Chironomus riparius]|uniref:Uncharacterized protein n=1 Tax=Chironomus riparius TaxID=315576 RepID=A0A9N9S0P8_9DIPT|nr:unnamed protein product [Chironomus riparius]